MIRRISNIVLKPISRDENGEIYSDVEIDGVNCGFNILGAYLEAAFIFQNKFILLFVTLEGGCFEELLQIYLVDQHKMKIIDYAEIGNFFGYAYGDVSDIQIKTNNTIFFKFLTTNGWLLTLYNKPVSNFSTFFRTFLTIKQPFLLKQYFSVIEVKA